MESSYFAVPTALYRMCREPQNKSSFSLSFLSQAHGLRDVQILEKNSDFFFNSYS